MAIMSELPNELINLVVKRLASLADVVRFSAVSKSLQSLVAHNRSKLPWLGPWLMLTTNNDNDSGFRSFFIFSTKTCFNLKFPHEYIHGKRCWGSPYGWLVTMGIDLNIHLLNPFSRTQLSLPPQSTFEYQYEEPLEPEDLLHYFVSRFVLCTNPSLSSNNSCVVMAIYGEACKGVAFARPGDEAWTSIQTPLYNNEDAILFDDKFYIVNRQGILLVCDTINTSHPKATEFASPPEGPDGTDRLYLVKMSGNLLLVEKVFNGCQEPDNMTLSGFHYITELFRVHKLDFQTRSWIRLSDLGNHALFLGMNTSFAISTSDHPAFKRGCIYYTDDHLGTHDRAFCDMGVYDYNTDTMEGPIYTGEGVLAAFSRPFFMMPSV